MFGKIGAGVDGAAIVPHEKIAELPDMLVDELGPLADFVELIEDGATFVCRHAFNARRHEAVDEQAFAASFRMRDEHRMIAMRNAAEISRYIGLLRALVFMDVERLLAREALLKLGWNRFIRFVHIREFRVAAGRRQLEGVEKSVLVGCSRSRYETRILPRRTRRSAARQP